MNREYHRWWSPHLNRDMELKIYGHGGKAILIFPSSSGKFYDYEDHNMLKPCQSFIAAGKIKLFNIDSIDEHGWLDRQTSSTERARHYDEYDRYIIHEIIPFIRSHGTAYEKIMSTGCGIGATHAANFFFKHPDLTDTLLGLSGIYSPQKFFGDDIDAQTYFHFPLAYLPNLTDNWFLAKFRESRLIFCTGQAEDEQDALADAQMMQQILQAKKIQATFDFWGEDVSHDWFWWQKQFPYFLQQLPFV